MAFPVESCRLSRAIDCSKIDATTTRQAARQQLGWPVDRTIILSVRRLVRRVGIDVLIEALGRLRSAGALGDALFYIGGSGPLRGELEKMISSLELDENVRLLGYVPESQLMLAYKAADLTVVPTQFLRDLGS